MPSVLPEPLLLSTELFPEADTKSARSVGIVPRVVVRRPGNRVLPDRQLFNSDGAVRMLRSRWIFDAPRDLTLFVATPVLILPLAFLICAAASEELFVLLVAAFGQVGHNLPALIPVYGDRDLFRRFRGRFILAPLLLGTACVFAAFQNLNVLVLAGVSWAIWHALMQTYGFVRIYASRGEFVEWSRCLAGFRDVCALVWRSNCSERAAAAADARSVVQLRWIPDFWPAG